MTKRLLGFGGTRLGLCVLLLLLLPGPAGAGPETTPRAAESLIEAFREAVEKVNKAHARSPGDATEEDLAGELPRKARKTLDRLLDMADGEAKWDALVAYAQAAADLDLIEDIARVERVLRKEAPKAAQRLGHYVSRDRFLLHAVRVDDAYADEFAEVFEGVLKGFDRTWGFAEFSKVPGKKVRVELHKEAQPKPPHFAPQFPFHSTIDYPIVKDDAFVSPTRDGRFLFYGLGHELGHLLAMWGDRRTMADHHAWAHYTGVVMVDACSKEPWAKRLRDGQRRSLKIEQRNLKDTAPSTTDRNGVLKLLIELHDLVGPKAIGAALNEMEKKGLGHRINRVRYYGLDDFERALLAGTKRRKTKAKIKKLFE